MVSVSFLFLVVALFFLLMPLSQHSFLFSFRVFLIPCLPCVPNQFDLTKNRVYAVHAHEFTDSLQGKREYLNLNPQRSTSK